MVVLNKLRVKNIEYDKCKFIFKLKYFVCVSCRAWLAWLIIIIMIMIMCHYYRFNVTFLCRTITSHLSLYYPYYHAFMIWLGYYHISGRLLLSDLIIWLFRAGWRRFRRLCYQTRWGFMGDFRVAKSTDFLSWLRSGMFFFDCNSKYVVLTRSWVKWYELNNIVN